jgi:hypothetical protein
MVTKFCAICGSTYILTKCTVQEQNPQLKNLVRQRCAEGFNSGVKGLIADFKLYYQQQQLEYLCNLARC